MSRWFRSEPMEYISLIVNEDAAHDCLADLGKLGVIQFTDVSHNYEYMMLLWYCYLSSGWSMYYFWKITVIDTVLISYLNYPIFASLPVVKS